MLTTSSLRRPSTSDLGLFHYSSSSFIAWLARFGQRPMAWLRSFLSRLSVSPWLSLLRRSWPLTWRVACTVLGIWFAITGAIADKWYSRGWDERNLQTIDRAAWLFPWNRTIAVQPGYYSYTFAESTTPQSISRLEAAVARDPQSADLTQALALAYVKNGNNLRAGQLLSHLLRIAPEAELSKQVRREMQ